MKISVTEEIKPRALKLVERASMPICIGDIARELGVSWATARQTAMLLALEKLF